MARGERWHYRSHCPQGHLFDEENTGVTTRGYPRCKTCYREKRRARYEGSKDKTGLRSVNP